MENYSKKRLMSVGMVSVGFVVVVIAVSVIMMILNSPRYNLVIDNLESCSSNIDNESKENLFSGVYDVITQQNIVNNKENKKDGAYHALFRDETCQSEEYSNYSFTSAIIDIEEAGYSYRVEYYWKKNGIKEEIDIGRVVALCLKENELKYGSFNCGENTMITSEFENDMILKVLPYIGDGFTIYPRIGENVDGTEYYYINIEYKPSDDIYINDKIDEFRTEKYEVAVKYLTEKGLNLDNYPIKESFWYVR